MINASNPAIATVATVAFRGDQQRENSKSTQTERGKNGSLHCIGCASSTWDTGREITRLGRGVQERYGEERWVEREGRREIPRGGRGQGLNETRDWGKRPREVRTKQRGVKEKGRFCWGSGGFKAVSEPHNPPPADSSRLEGGVVGCGEGQEVNKRRDA